MKMRNVLLMPIILMSFTACNRSADSDGAAAQNQVARESYVLFGKKALLTYPTQKYEVSYGSDSTVHWKQVEDAKVLSEGRENIKYEQLNDYQFFLSWVEEDGFTVSQVIDMKENKVYAYMSWADTESPRGGRAADLAVGEFEILE